MAYKQSKNPFGKSPLNFSSPLNSFDSLVGKLMNQGKSKEAATKIAGKIANMKMKGAGSGPTAAQKARAKGSPAKQAKPDFLDLDKDGDKTEPMKEAAKGSPAKAKGGRKNHPGSDEDYKKHVARNSTKADEHHHKSSPFNRQGYDDRLDESLAKDGKESSKKQSMKDRRDESKGMEKSKGKGAYSSDPKMS